MASSDEEQEIVSDSVSDFEFLDFKNELVSFAELPVAWDEKAVCEKSRSVFLSGKIDNGLRKVYTEVVAWKFDLSCDKKRPEISVLSINGKWLKLLKPRSRFQVIVRTIRISVNFLHFCKWHPQGSERALWDHLDKLFSMFEERPSEHDLQGHFSLIKEAVKRDETLGNSKILSAFMEEKLSKRKVVDEDIRAPFIVDDADGYEDEKSTGMDEEEASECDQNEYEDQELDKDDCYDCMCSICDNGGNVLICDGKCLRVFHPTLDDGADSFCETLGFTEEEYEATDLWLCKNCEYKRHQCYACKELGSSDDSNSPEVFCCVNGACGYFYHPLCVAKLLHPENIAEANEHAQRIALGEPFACPAHRCHLCKELEMKSVHELQFAVCRRCPRVYHRKCLPREIAFEKDLEEDSDRMQRAWEGLIPNRILIYCLEHEIDPEISTPARDHLKFPGPQQKGSKRLQSSRTDQDILNEGTLASGPRKRSFFRKPESGKVSNYSKGDFSQKRFKKQGEIGSDSMKRLDAYESNRRAKDFPGLDKKKTSLGDQLFNKFYGSGFEQKSSFGVQNAKGKIDPSSKVNLAARNSDDADALDADTKRRILTLIEDASCSITLDKVRKRHKAPSTHAVDFITLAKLQCVQQALHAAREKLEDGGNVQDAKVICGDDILGQVQRWRQKLRVFLAPFLHGQRYTSFGRHFTKIEKLKKVIDILQWYVEDGDMVVDFCCGSNDFSCLMKARLDSLGKKVSFKNYDIVQPKNDFNFERKDWMTVKTNDLPPGSQLIMGLNPPFGVNAALANKFIDKALTFKPKLIILIVPRETERLDLKAFPYDLIFEDTQMFVGKSFYIPGSVDGNDKQLEDWNVNSPVLYLWSHPDFTLRHRSIFEQHRHLLSCVIKTRSNGSDEQIHATNSSEGRRDPAEFSVDQAGATRQENLQKQVKGKVETGHQNCLPEGSGLAQKKTNSEESSSKFNGTKKRERDNVPPAKSSRQFSGPYNPSPHAADHLKKHSSECAEALHPIVPPRRIDHPHFDYSSIATYEIPAYDEAEAASVVSRYHNVMSDEGAQYYGAGSAASPWTGHLDNRAYFMDSGGTLPYANGRRPEEHVPWSQGHVPQAYYSPTVHPSYGGQLDAACRMLGVEPMQLHGPHPNFLDHGRLSNAPGPAPGQYNHDPVGVRYNPPPGPPPAHQGGPFGYAPGPYGRYPP